MHTFWSHITHPLTFALRLAPAYGRAIMLVLAVLVSVVLLQVFPGNLETVEERLGALGWTLRPAVATEQRISIIAIDEKSLAEVGPWPWQRADMARLVTALNNAGVQLQIHDIVYTEPKADDDLLITALSEAPGVVLAQAPAIQSEQDVRSGVLTHPLSGLSCGPGVSTTSAFFGAHAGFRAFPKGHISPVVATDGAIRKQPAYICVDGQAYPALALAALLTASKAESWAATTQTGNGLFVAAQTLNLSAYPGLQIPLDVDGNLRISYQNAPETFRAISAVDVINGEFDPDMLDNTWALVGTTAFGVGDIVPTPYSGATPGIELQARMLASMLDTTLPYTPAVAPLLLLLVSGLCGGLLVLLASASNRWAAYGLPAAAVALPVVALGIHIQLLSSQNLWLGWMAPALFSMMAASLLLLFEQARVRLERNRVYTNLHSYLPADIAREIAYSLPNSSVNAHRRQVTLLSADLRNFSAFGEARPPEESAAVLHFFFTRANSIVEHHGGRIHEFKGDGLLAIWDGNDTLAAQQALLSAQELHQAIHNDMLPLYPPQGLEPLALGVGIEQGPVLLGSIGPARRRTHTLLGDTVTIAIRIQELTAEVAQPILVGECAARQLSGSNLQSQGSYLLHGLRNPHTLYAPPPAERDERKSRPDQPSLKVIAGGRS